MYSAHIRLSGIVKVVKHCCFSDPHIISLHFRYNNYYNTLVASILSIAEVKCADAVLEHMSAIYIH